VELTDIGFIGLGAMGDPMARALLRAGYTVAVCAHRRRDRLAPALQAGATEVPDGVALGERSAIIITCVPDAPEVKDALFGSGGAAVRAREGTLFVDMSTISPFASREVAAELASRKLRFVDAPVSGGPARAETGTLAIMAGASDDDFAAVKPVLDAMGTPYHVGAVGLGETVKLVNQVIIASIMIANIEGLTFAREAGADSTAVREVLKSATASNYLLEQWLPKTWLAGTFGGGFALDLLRKDLAAALDAARTMNVPMPASALAYQLYTRQSSQGDGALDYSAVAKFYERVG
jgi:3-hydroxyisobutyrate dehydrogenase-like beta-hydroxyacid dehydrogenase